MQKCNDKIDFVVTWVDDGDPVWRADKERFSMAGTDKRNARFREWDQLKYWFRAVEKYAPWVNKIHFVTYGHLPKWLNVNHPKLHIVNHCDFIPEQYLPVFNSTAIEVHMHKIPTLSEQFVYFCDDFYLMNPCKPTDFFKNGKPVDFVELIPTPTHQGEMYYYHLYNDYSIYRSYASTANILKNFWKYATPKYGSTAINNLLNIAAKNIFFRSLHLPMPLLKKTMEEIWEMHGDVLEKTASSRFRQITNNSPETFRGYQLITGNFCPKRKKGIILSTQNVIHTKKTIEQCKYKYICLSDNSEDCEFEEHKKQINESFEKVFSRRSSFEQPD